MKDRNPCIYPKICDHRYPGCQSKCKIGAAYFKKQTEEREQAKAAEREESSFGTYLFDRKQESMKRAGR